jgi:hypothetical protein
MTERTNPDLTRQPAHTPETFKVSTEELPLWMQQARQGVDWGIVIVALFCLLVAWPFLLQEGLPRTNASENHVFMAGDYAAALREGRLYPRWSAAALGGYGAPVPHYYPPGAPYTAALVETLFTNDTVTAVRVVYILALVLAGTATYALVTRQSGAAAGILAALLYVYSPYVGLTAPHILGDLPGVIALALLPALLWAAHRLLLADRGLDFAAVALCGAALLLTTPQSALIGGLLALTLAGWLQNNRRAWLRLISALVLAGLLASFFWLPALLERDSVTWQPPPYQPLPLALTLRELLSPPARVDLNELVTSPRLTLGIAVPLLALAGAYFIWRERQRRDFHALFLLCALGIAAAALLVFPHEVWLLGPLTLCLAIGAGAILRADGRSAPPSARLRLPLLVILVLYAAAPVWLAPYWPQAFGDTGPAAQIVHEQQGYGVAVLPPGASTPLTLSPAAIPSRSLISSYQTGVPLRVVPGQFSASSQLSLLESHTHSEHYLARISSTATFDILRAYFPGWQAQINGSPLMLSAQPDSGLTQVEVPPVSNRTLTIHLGTTPPRRAAWALSWGMLLLLVIITVRRRRRQRDPSFAGLTFIDRSQARLLAPVLAGFGLIVLVFAWPGAPYTLHARPGHGLDHSIALRSRTPSGLEALSYRLDHADYRPGQTLEFFLAWRTPRLLLRNYRVQVFVEDTGGARWIQTEPRYPGGYPTRRWATNRYVRDPYRISLPSHMLAGTYRIGVEVFDCDPDCAPENRLEFFGPDGEYIGPVLTLPTSISIRP